VNSALLLASNSPRRRELLAAAGFKFAIVEPRIAEKSVVDLSARELTTLNAIRKGISVARVYACKIILAADTVVVLGHEIIGKPSNYDAAVKMLRRLNGRTHEVCSAVFICDPARRRSMSFYEISRVHFRRLSEPEVRAYLDKVNPLDKAGAYAAQRAGGEIIRKIEGSYTNVVGLPMEKTIARLAEFGISPSAR
jgi:septum formation protein